MRFPMALLVMLGWAIAAIATIPAAAQTLHTHNYQEMNEDFANPERGFLHFRDLTSPSNYAQVRAAGHSLIYGRILADDFRNGPLSQSFLDQIQAGFDQVRQHGIKVKFRVMYNNGFQPDAPKSVILNHIQQLQPLWEANKDVIYHMDAGFIGAWGEWHSSTNGLDNNTDRSDILRAILGALPSDRMVGIRTPGFKRHIFNGSPTSDANVITPQTAFDGSHLSRVGHLNDCFLSSPNDMGTYVHQHLGWPIERELEYIGGESRFAPHGGETCALHDRNRSQNAISEMEKLHTDYLNIDWHPDVIERWVDEGSFDEISRRLGYRFALRTAKLPHEIRPGGLMELQFDVNNVGFGELFNPRDVEVTLKNNATGVIETAPLQVDPRFWVGGGSDEVQAFLSVPESMAEGTYTVGLWLPDKEASLRPDVRYAIRFANAGVWNAATGINELFTNLQISNAADGSIYAGFEEFEEVLDPDSLTPILDSDFDRDGDVDGDDFLIWQSQFGAPNPNGGDADRDGDVDGNDFLIWQSQFGNASGSTSALVPEPSAIMLLFVFSAGVIGRQ